MHCFWVGGDVIRLYSAAACADPVRPPSIRAAPPPRAPKPVAAKGSGTAPATKSTAVSNGSGKVDAVAASGAAAPPAAAVDTVCHAKALPR